MARKPRDFDTELQALMNKAKKLKSQKTVQLGELVQVTGADALPVEALAGALLAAVEQSKKTPEAVTRWVGRGQALFQAGGKRGSKTSITETYSRTCKRQRQGCSGWQWNVTASTPHAPGLTHAIGPRHDANAPGT